MSYYNSLERFGRTIGEDALTWNKEAIDVAEAIVIGAGAGLSTSAGFVYDGERFEKCFYDFSFVLC